MTAFYKTKEFLNANMMGPNSVRIVEELLQKQIIKPNAKVLDLGCGRGLTSIALAEMVKANVFALDLWIEADENYQTFKACNLENLITPIHADIMQKPFANEFFDALVSIDAYHYFGRDKDVMDTHIAPMVKQGGLIALAFPGLKKDIHDNIPPELLKVWTAEDIAHWHDVNWWKDLLSQSNSIEILEIKEMDCYESAWADWLACDNPYALEDKIAMENGGFEHMNLISIIAKKK